MARRSRKRTNQPFPIVEMTAGPEDNFTRIATELDRRGSFRERWDARSSDKQFFMAFNRDAPGAARFLAGLDQRAGIGVGTMFKSEMDRGPGDQLWSLGLAPHAYAYHFVTLVDSGVLRAVGKVLVGVIERYPEIVPILAFDHPLYNVFAWSPRGGLVPLPDVR